MRDDSHSPRLDSERGQVLIHVAFALLALLAISGFVVEHGLMWTARVQAQAAADAGALAGAGTLEADLTNTTGATQAAQFFAGKTAVWGQTTAPADVVVSPLPYNCPASAGGGSGCIRVDVLRGVPDRANNAHSNTLPVFFTRMVGITSQGVRATATAQVAQGNSVTCIKPWIVADKWTEGDEAPIGGWNQNDTFNPPIDTYTAPGFKATGPNNDYGLELVLKAGNVGTYTAGWTQEIEFPGCPGSACYKAELEGCPTWVPPVNLYNGNIPCAAKTDTPDPSQGCISVKTGMSAGPTGQGVTAIVASDSGASWSTATNSVVGGCMASGTCINPDGVNVSPRIVPIAIFNTGAYYTEANGGACNGGTNCVAQVVNLIGFFVEGMCTDVYPNPASRPAWCGTPSEAAKAVVGRLMNYPGLGVRGAGPATSASFIRILRLVQ